MTLIKDKAKQQNTEEYAYKRMLDYGWKPHQAAAIVGNLKRESNFNTTIVGTADTKQSQGVGQWHSERLSKLKNMYGSNWTDLDNQLEFVNWELGNTHKNAGDALRATTSVWDAGRVVTDKYERPKIGWTGDEKRQTYVTDTYRKFSGVQLTPEDKENFLRGTAQRAIDNYNATQQNSTNVINLSVSQQNTNLATVPEQDKEVESAKEEIQEKETQINEQNFMRELFADNEEPEDAPIQEPIKPQAPQQNILQNYAQIENFVDSPIMQQGGIPISSRGVYDYPRQEVIVPTHNGRVTMAQVPYPILGTDEFGNQQMMHSNGEYQFPGKIIHEIPQIK